MNRKRSPAKSMTVRRVFGEPHCRIRSRFFVSTLFSSAETPGRVVGRTEDLSRLANRGEQAWIRGTFPFAPVTQGNRREEGSLIAIYLLRVYLTRRSIKSRIVSGYGWWAAECAHQRFPGGFRIIRNGVRGGFPRWLSTGWSRSFHKRSARFAKEIVHRYRYVGTRGSRVQWVASSRLDLLLNSEILRPAHVEATS